MSSRSTPPKSTPPSSAPSKPASARFKIDPFLPALVGVVVLAILWPAPGVTGGFLHADRAATWGIGVIFFLYGISLATRRLLESATRWQLHLVVQLATFALFPLVVVLAMPLINRLMPEEVGIGFFFLAALPSTVSSSVAMTSLARGNVPVAIFNASVSSLIGVFVTPLLMAWYLHATGGTMALGDVILKLVLIVLLPLAVGQMLRPLLLKLVEKHKVVVKIADRAVILAIVYNAFCDSVAEGVWSGHSVALLVEMVAGVGLLFVVVYLLIGLFCRLVGFNHADTTAVLFCGSKKSLATGLPIAKVMFGTSPQLSLIITPIMIYHFLQLVVIGVIAGNRAARGEVLEAIAEEEPQNPRSWRMIPARVHRMRRSAIEGCAARRSQRRPFPLERGSAMSGRRGSPPRHPAESGDGCDRSAQACPGVRLAAPAGAAQPGGHRARSADARRRG